MVIFCNYLVQVIFRRFQYRTGSDEKLGGAWERGYAMSVHVKEYEMCMSVLM